MKQRFQRLAALLSSLEAVTLAAGCLTAPSGDPGRRPAAALDVEVSVKALAEEPWSDPTRVIVEVNGKPITQGELYRRILRQLGTRKALEGVVTQEIVLQEASRRGIKVTPDEVDRKIDDVVLEEERQAGGRANLERQYEDAGLTMAEAREDHRHEVESQLLLAKVVKALRNVDDNVLTEYYKATYAKARHATRHIAFSFRPDPSRPDEDPNQLKLEAHSKAARAADRIRKGADFAALARAESDDTVTAARGGELGAISNDSKMVPEFMRGVFKLGVLEVSDPVENPVGGYHVFQVTAILPGESFADCKEKMRREILEREPSLEEVRAALLALRKEAQTRAPSPEPRGPFAPTPSEVPGSEKKAAGKTAEEKASGR